MNKSYDFVCINCPRGCQLHVDEKMNVTGNFCPRGKSYAISEITNPTRTITSTVFISSKIVRVCPCKTSIPVSKKLVFEVMKEINKVCVNAPIHIGDIIIKNVCDSGADIISTRDIEI